MLCPLDASSAVSAAKPVPFATVYLTLTKQEHIQLVMQANSWKTQHRRALERAQWREGRYRRVLRQVKEQAAHRSPNRDRPVSVLTEAAQRTQA